MPDGQHQSRPRRRDLLRSIVASIPVLTLDWDMFPAARAQSAGDGFDAVIVGSGLGGLSCAAALARKGYKALVLEQHDRPGGYATTFARPGGFVFDVSLHSTVVGERNGVRNLISGFPEITEVEFVPHTTLYRAIFPEHDIRVPPRDVPGYVAALSRLFPDEKENIKALFEDMKGLTRDVGKLSGAGAKVDMSRFPSEFPYLYRWGAKTWGEMLGARITNPRLQGIVSSLWVYFGLPPSRLSAMYYAMPLTGYLEEGGYYPKGKSQKISDALVKFIETRGGKVLLKSRVERILVKEGAAYGVKCASGEYRARAVVSNANAWDTFHTLLEPEPRLKDYLARLDAMSVSLSCFQVFLGLKQDLVGKSGIADTEIFYAPGYDVEADYRDALAADVANCGYCVTLYDNLYKGYSPPGKNTINVIVLQGYDHWRKYEADYRAGRKAAYRAAKERMADILLARVEKALLPGLRKAIEVKEIGTPLTNFRYTGNYRGAIYGWDQTVDNTPPRRLPNATPIRNLYLAGAWTTPGHGYGAVIASGLQCFGEIMKAWG